MNKIFLFLIFVMLSAFVHGQNAPVQRGSRYYCDYSVYGVWQPTEECAESFNYGFETITQDPKHVEIYQAEVERLKGSNAIAQGEVYWTLFRSYPSTSALFKSLDADANFHKKNQKSYVFYYDDPAAGIIRDYAHSATKYDLVIAMLEDRATRIPLTGQEHSILDTSRRRTTCLKDYLDFMRNNPSQLIDDKDVVNTCYQ